MQPLILVRSYCNFSTNVPENIELELRVGTFVDQLRRDCITTNQGCTRILASIIQATIGNLIICRCPPTQPSPGPSTQSWSNQRDLKCHTDGTTHDHKPQNSPKTIHSRYPTAIFSLLWIQVPYPSHAAKPTQHNQGPRPLAPSPPHTTLKILLQSGIPSKSRCNPKSLHNLPAISQRTCRRI